MDLQTLTLGGKEYVVVPRDEFDRLTAGAGGLEFVPGKIPLPPLPEANADGNRPALAFIRTTIAREIIGKMNAAGINQAELARRSGVPRETLNRIIKCTRTPDETTMAKIEKALGGEALPPTPRKKVKLSEIQKAKQAARLR